MSADIFFLSGQCDRTECILNPSHRRLGYVRLRVVRRVARRVAPSPTDTCTPSRRGRACEHTRRLCIRDAGFVAVAGARPRERLRRCIERPLPSDVQLASGRFRQKTGDEERETTAPTAGRKGRLFARMMDSRPRVQLLPVCRSAACVHAVAAATPWKLGNTSARVAKCMDFGVRASTPGRRFASRVSQCGQETGAWDGPRF